MFSSSGPAGVFALYVMPGMNLFRVFVNEFVMVTTEIQTGVNNLPDYYLVGFYHRLGHLGLPRPNEPHDPAISRTWARRICIVRIVVSPRILGDFNESPKRCCSLGVLTCRK